MNKNIYFIRPKASIGPIKIGCSEFPVFRLPELARWSPVALEIIHTMPGSFELERNIHCCLANSHSHAEWFNADDRVRAVVDGLLAGRDLSEVLDLSRVEGTIRGRRWSAQKCAAKGAFYAFAAAARQAGYRSNYTYPTPQLATIFKAMERRPATDAELALIEAAMADPLGHVENHNAMETAA